MNEPVTSLHSSSLNVIYLHKMADLDLTASPTESNICHLCPFCFTFVSFPFFMDFPRLLRHEHVLSFDRLPPPAFWVKYGPTPGQTGILMCHGPVSALFLLPGVFHPLE